MNKQDLMGWQVLLIALAFFGTIIGANAVMVTYALSTFSGDDEGNAYKQGLEFNQTLDRRAKAKASGIEVTVDATRDAAGKVELAVRASDKGETVGGLTLTGVLRHPANSALDRPVIFEANGGAYRAELVDVQAGQWDLLLTGTRADTEVVEARERLWLR